MTTTTKCCHHWIIKVAAGPTSEGHCCKCEERRPFSNTWVDYSLRLSDDPESKEIGWIKDLRARR